MNPCGNLPPGPSSLPPGVVLDPDPVAVPLIVPGGPVASATTVDRLASITTVHDAAQTILGYLVQTVQAALGAAQDTCEQCYQSCRNTIEGRLQRIVDQAALPLQKCVNKVVDKCSRLLGTAYGYCNQLGIGYPTAEQVIYGLSTGDYLGSCGLTPPTCLPPQQPVPVVPAPPVAPPTPAPSGSVPAPAPAVPPPSPVPIQPVPPPVPSTNGHVGIQSYPLPTTVTTVQQTAVIDPPPASQPCALITAHRTWTDGTFTQLYVDQLKAIPKGHPDWYCLDKQQREDWEVITNLTQAGVPPDQIVPVPDIPEDKFSGPWNWTFPPRWTPKPPDMSDPQICRILSDYVKRLKDPQGGVSKLLGFDATTNPKTAPDWLAPFLSEIPGPIADGIFWVLKGGLDLMDTLASNVPTPPNCNNQAMKLPSIVLQIGSLLEKWLGFSLQRYLEPYRQIVNYTCPTQIPTTADAINGYLSGQIDEETMKCLARANNDIDSWITLLAWGQRTRLDPFQTIDAHRRKFIDRDEMQKRLRGLGVTDPVDGELLQKLADAQPGLDDVIRFMVRDVADRRLVERFGMDDDFEKKWQEPLKYYGDALGVTPELAKLYWRAHWQLPSPTQLYEMLHRLRPGRVPKGVEVTAKDVEDALKQNDMLPFWVPREMAVSYRVMTRTDAQRSYFIGALLDDELLEIYQDEGYSLDTARLLLRFTKALKKQRDQRKQGIKPASFWVNAYVKDQIGGQSLLKKLKRIYDDPQTIERIMTDADEQRQMRLQTIAIKAIKQRYQTADLDDGQAAYELNRLDLEPTQIRDLLAAWRVERMAKDKAIPAAMLCRWRKLRLITPAQQAARLVKLGYSSADASRIVAECEWQMTEQQQKEMEKATKAAQQQREKEEKKAAQQRKDEEKKKKEEEKKKKGGSAPAPKKP